jgi:hypothetical protein
MRGMVLRDTLITAILVGVGCTAYMYSLQSSFFSKFSLPELVEKNKSRSGLDCSAGGGGIGIGVGGGGGFSRKEFQSHKGESFSCRLSDRVEKFDEAGFIAALRQDVERDITESGAKIIDSGNPDASSFYLEYELEDARGRVEITGRKIREEYYSLKADLNERGKRKSK